MCAGCSEPFISGDVVATCSICLDLYHANEKSSEGSGQNCSSASATEIRVIKMKLKKLMVYRCPECTKNGGDSPSMLEVVAKLQESVDKQTSAMKESSDKLSTISETLDVLTKVDIPKINESVADLVMSYKNLDAKVEDYIFDNNINIGSLKENFNILDAKVDSLSSKFAAADKAASIGKENSSISADESTFTLNILNEIEDRKHREKHLIIYNAKEQLKQVNVELKKTYDFELVLELFVKIQNITTKLDPKKVKRIGKFVKGKTRPLLVKFDNRDDVTNIITHWRDVPGKVHVSYDLTKCQRSSYNCLKGQASDFNTNVDNIQKNIKQVVKFRNGNPKLITVKINPLKGNVAHRESIYESSGVNQKN